MLNLLELNKDNLLNGSNNFVCEDDIYGILLKTGLYINAKDFYY